jgi:hypothetical protein
VPMPLTQRKSAISMQGISVHLRDPKEHQCTAWLAKPIEASGLCSCKLKGGMQMEKKPSMVNARECNGQLIMSSEMSVRREIMVCLMQRVKPTHRSMILRFQISGCTNLVVLSLRCRLIS